MKKLFILPILLLYLFLVASPLFAQSAVLTATVTVNPLRVEVFAPSNVVVGEWFEIRAEVFNLGESIVGKTFVSINKHSRLQVRSNKKRIGDLLPGDTEIVIWTAKINDTGEFVVLAEVVGMLSGEEISASDDVVISSTSSLVARFFRLIFGLGVIDSV